MYLPWYSDHSISRAARDESVLDLCLWNRRISYHEVPQHKIAYANIHHIENLCAELYMLKLHGINRNTYDLCI